MLRLVVVLILFLAGGRSDALELSVVVEGLTAPIGLADPDDGSKRLFIQEQTGLVQVLGSDGTLDAPLLDLRPRMIALEEGFEERGLLGFALHPDFASNGRVYVSYSAPLRADAPPGWNYTRRVSELTLAPGAESIDLGSERVLLSLDWPSRKHNGGGLAFGPDGFLYIGIGDGGGAHGVGPDVIWSAFDVPADQLYWDRLAQDETSLFGAILRIDVDAGFPGYGIPDTNPFVGKPGRDEIFAWGFRNPYRLGIDPVTGAIAVTAVAETLWESVYLVQNPGNFGWPLREGTHCVDRLQPRNPPLNCAQTGPRGHRIEVPVVEYPNMQVMHPDTQIDGDRRRHRSGRCTPLPWRGDPGAAGQAGVLPTGAPSSRPRPGSCSSRRRRQGWGDLWPFERMQASGHPHRQSGYRCGRRALCADQ